MTQPAPPADTPRPRRIRLGGAVSLEWKLPLIMTGFLALGLATMLWFADATLEARAKLVVRERLQAALGEVTSSAAASIAFRGRLLDGIARDPAVRDALRAAASGDTASVDTAAVRAALARAATPPASPTDTLLPVELWNAAGSPLAHVGPALPVGERALPRSPTAGAAPGESGVYAGPLHTAGEGARFWMMAPVRDEGRVVGYVAQLRGVGGPRDATRMLRMLIGEDVRIFTRNSDGSVWASASSGAPAAPQRRWRDEHGLWHLRADVGPALAAEQPIPGTPWVLVLETPESWVVARPRETARALGWMAAGVALLGALLSWMVSRRITHPLTTLTAASESVALGTYHRQVASGGSDEIGRLAASFDAMARQVGAARAELERRVADAQASAEELASVNDRLRAAAQATERARHDAERARAEAEQASRAKSDFLAVMSHELRTPLNAIGGYAQLMEMGIHGPVTDAQREALGRIARSQEHLLALINDVLSFARIDAGQVRYAIGDVSLASALAEVDALVAPQMAAAGLRFTLDAGPPGLAARADPDKLRQVLLNLLGNAVKYTPSGGAVAVACAAGDDTVSVRVADTGTGIPPERLPHIFEPFVQGDRALNSPDEGVGLGLAISRDLARGMGGDVSVETELGRGSVFTVVLPRADRASSADAAEAGGEPDARRRAG